MQIADKCAWSAASSTAITVRSGKRSNVLRLHLVKKGHPELTDLALDPRADANWFVLDREWRIVRAHSDVAILAAHQGESIWDVFPDAKEDSGCLQLCEQAWKDGKASGYVFHLGLLAWFDLAVDSDRLAVRYRIEDRLETATLARVSASLRRIQARLEAAAEAPPAAPGCGSRPRGHLRPVAPARQTADR